MYTNYIILYLRFCYLLFIQRCFLRGNIYKSNSFILVSIQYPIIYHNLVTHDGEYWRTFGFLRDFTITYHVSLNILIPRLLDAKVSLRNITRSRIARWGWVGSVCTEYSKYCQIAFQSGRTHLESREECEAPPWPHSCQYLLCRPYRYQVISPFSHWHIQYYFFGHWWSKTIFHMFLAIWFSYFVNSLLLSFVGFSTGFYMFAYWFAKAIYML